MSISLTVIAWGLLAAAVINGVGRWSREASGPSTARVITPDRDVQR